MKLNYSLSQEDYLNFQLYYGLRSPYGKKLRTRNWLIVPLIYTFFASILFFTSSPIFSISFLILAILWLLFYPSFQKRRMAKVYKNYNIEQFQRRFDKPVEVSFDKLHVNLKDYAGEAKINLIEIDEMREVENYYYLKFTTGVVLIIPKQKIDTIDELKAFLEALVKKSRIKYVPDLEWKW